jgi:fatty-acid peroxygenase
MPSTMPRDPALDSTITLLRQGYEFLSNKRRQLNADVFEIRLLGQSVIAMSGQEAAALFYDPARFERSGAAPTRLKKTLTGEGGMPSPDGLEHQQRKGIFMRLMTEPRMQDLIDIARAEWESAIYRWQQRAHVVLHDSVQEILCRTICLWAGVPLPETDVHERTLSLASMFDGAAALGPRHWAARRARKEAELWMMKLVERVRAGELATSPDTALHAFALARNVSGRLLEPGIAAIEILNVLRPTVAISAYVTFAALALHEHPEYRDRLRQGDPKLLDAFAQEVRRFYPFFPFMVAKVKERFEWNGIVFPEGRRTMLDIYGTNHDARLFDDPYRFRPERFCGKAIDPYAFIPQGGGEPHEHHRCAGEWLTLALMRVSVETLIRDVLYRVPPQDLRVDLSRIPALPQSRFIIEHVRFSPKEASAESIPPDALDEIEPPLRTATSNVSVSPL